VRQDRHSTSVAAVVDGDKFANKIDAAEAGKCALASTGKTEPQAKGSYAFAAAAGSAWLRTHHAAPSPNKTKMNYCSSAIGNAPQPKARL